MPRCPDAQNMEYFNEINVHSFILYYDSTSKWKAYPGTLASIMPL